MAKRIFINKHAVQGFLIQYKEKHNLNNSSLERLTGISNATISGLCYAKQDCVTEKTYTKLNSFIPEHVLQVPMRGQVTLEEIQEAEKVGFTQTYVATADNVVRKVGVLDIMDEMEKMSWEMEILKEYLQKIHNQNKEIFDKITSYYSDLTYVTQDIEDIYFLINNKPTLWQRIKNKFRRNHSIEKTYTNADENLRKK